MSRGVVLWPDAATDRSVRALWTALEEAGVPTLPTRPTARLTAASFTAASSAGPSGSAVALQAFVTPDDATEAALGSPPAVLVGPQRGGRRLLPQ